MSQKIFENNLVAIRKSKVALTLSKPAYAGMCILDLSKVLMYEFQYDYIENRYDNNSRLLFTDTDSLMYETKTEDVYEDFSKDKKMFEFSNYSTKSKFYDDCNTLVVGKMKDKTTSVSIKEFVGLQPKMYSFLVDDRSDHKKAKSVNKNVVVTISFNEYKNLLFNQKCLRHLMKRTQSNNHRIGTYEMNKIVLSYFDDKLYIINNEYDGLALSHQSEL